MITNEQADRSKNRRDSSLMEQRAQLVFALLAAVVAPTIGCKCEASEEEHSKSGVEAPPTKCQSLTLNVQVLETKRLLLLPNLTGKLTILRSDGSVHAEEAITRRERSVSFSGSFFATGGITLPRNGRFQIRLVDSRKKILGGYDNVSYGTVAGKLPEGRDTVEAHNTNFAAEIDCQK